MNRIIQIAYEKSIIQNSQKMDKEQQLKVKSEDSV